MAECWLWSGVIAAIAALVGAGALLGDPAAFHLPLLEVRAQAGGGEIPAAVLLPEAAWRRVLLPLAQEGFDPTEVAVPWHVLTSAGHTVTFATPLGGEAPRADQLVLDTYLLGLIGASALTRRLYARLQRDAAFQRPLSFADIDVAAFDGLLLPGGHAPATVAYLESEVLQAKVRAFWAQETRTVGAVCHGVLVLSRAGVLAGGTRTTAVTRDMERAAYHLTRPLYGRYHLSTTWPRYTQDLIEQESGGARFDAGPANPLHTLWLGTATDHRRSHVVEDGRYVSARFPGDVWTWSLRFGKKLADDRRY